MKRLSINEIDEISGGATFTLPFIPIPLPGIPLPGSPVPGLSSVEFGEIKPVVSFTFSPEFNSAATKDIGKNIGKF